MENKRILTDEEIEKVWMDALNKHPHWEVDAIGLFGLVAEAEHEACKKSLLSLADVKDGELEKLIGTVMCEAVRYAYCAEKEVGCIGEKGDCKNIHCWVEKISSKLSPVIASLQQKVKELEEERNKYKYELNKINQVTLRGIAEKNVRKEEREWIANGLVHVKVFDSKEQFYQALQADNGEALTEKEGGPETDRSTK